MVGEITPRSFVLEDQFSREHTVKFPSKERLSILVVADREGSAQVPGWVEALYRRYGDRIPIHGIAALPNVPFFVRPALKAMFRRNIKQPLLLDWGSQFSDLFGFSPGQTLVVILNQEGRVLFRSRGPASRDRLSACFRAVDAFLLSNKPHE